MARRKSHRRKSRKSRKGMRRGLSRRRRRNGRASKSTQQQFKIPLVLGGFAALAAFVGVWPMAIFFGINAIGSYGFAQKETRAVAKAKRRRDERDPVWVDVSQQSRKVAKAKRRRDERDEEGY